MAKPCIDVDYKGEERYTKIVIAYDTDEQRREIDDALAKIHEDNKLERNFYETVNPQGRKLIVIEYHDDYDREAGAVFEELMKLLHIEQCNL